MVSPKIKAGATLIQTAPHYGRIVSFGRKGTPMDIVERCFVAAAAASLLLIAATAWFELS
jgi:hypothetical protein